MEPTVGQKIPGISKMIPGHLQGVLPANDDPESKESTSSMSMAVTQFYSTKMFSLDIYGIT